MGRLGINCKLPQHLQSVEVESLLDDLSFLDLCAPTIGNRTLRSLGGTSLWGPKLRFPDSGSMVVLMNEVAEDVGDVSIERPALWKVTA